MGGPYHEASVLFNKYLSSKVKSNDIGGLKSLVFKRKSSNVGGDGSTPQTTITSTEMTCKKSTYAIVCQVIQAKPQIDLILDDSNGKLRKLVLDKCYDKGLCYILLYELLFSKFKSIRGGGKLKRIILKYEDTLQNLAERFAAKDNNKNSTSAATAIEIPRYVRINTIRTTYPEAVKVLLEEADSIGIMENKIAKIYQDAHVPYLVVLPHSVVNSKTEFHSHPLIQEGKIILQDKSSCFPALALVHASKDMFFCSNRDTFDILDACAAPGNKTSHVAALLDLEWKRHSNSTESKSKEGKKKKKDKTKSTGSNRAPKVIALDRNPSRFGVLKDRMNQLVGTSDENTERVQVKPLQADFLQTDPSDEQFQKVRGILLDPSCSGSGIVTSPDRINSSYTVNGEEENTDKHRIQSLASFQLKALRHAMSFPQVDRIVYSTCSVHKEENEGVVYSALYSVDQNNEGDVKKSEDWELISPSCFMDWTRRGNPDCGLTSEEANCLIRCDATKGDETNGFFVSCFQRKNSLEVVSAPESDKDVMNESISFVESFLGNETVPLSTYNGEFHKKEKAEIIKTLKSEPSIVSTKKEKFSDDRKTSSSPKITCKKKEKRLKWKQKQRDMKKKRILQKKAKDNATKT